MTAATHTDVTWKRRSRISVGRVLLYSFLVLTAALWIVPIAGAIFASFRPFQDTVRDGFFSWPEHLTLHNYQNAWAQGDILHKYWNTTLILVPSLDGYHTCSTSAIDGSIGTGGCCQSSGAVEGVDRSIRKIDVG